MFQRHGLFAAALLLGAGVRIVAMLGFRPAEWYPDSYHYVGLALRFQPDPVRPVGYSAFLALLERFGGFELVTAVQHLLGLAVAVLLYALLRRRSVPGWLATVAVLPPLLDGNQVHIEHMVLSETLFTFLIIGGLVVLLWDRVPSVRAVAVAGVLLAAAGVVRFAGLPVLASAGAYSLLRLPGWRARAAGGLAVALPLLGYAAWFQAEHGRFALTSRSLLDSRVAAATRPFDYARGALRDFGRAFSWSPQPFPTPGHLEAYRFSHHPLRIPTEAVYVPGASAMEDAVAYERGPADTRVVRPYADAMIAYQRYVTLRGPVLAALLVVGALSLAGIRRRVADLELGPAMLLWAASMLLLLAPPFLTTFDHRYVLPAVPLAAAAAGWTAAGYLRRLRSPPATRPTGDIFTGSELATPACELVETAVVGDRSLYETVLDSLAGDGATGTPSPKVRASAAVVLCRRDADGALEVFWVRRAPELKFMGGWYAFPGGAVGRGDAEIAVGGRPAGVDGAPADGGMPVEFLAGASPLPEILAPGVMAAGLRELFEETGLLVTAGGDPGGERVEAIRRRSLESRRSSAADLVAAEIELDASPLVYAGRWLTPPLGPVRFDNRFFLLEWPAARARQPEIVPGELAAGEWTRPAHALEAWRGGGVLAAPPILHILRVLDEEGPEAAAPRLRDAREANVAGFRRIEFAPGAMSFPLATPTLPPATHTNAYLLGFGECVLVDPGSPDGGEQRRLLTALEHLAAAEGRRVTQIWLTHHHPDHVGGVAAVARALDVPVLAHPSTAERLAGIEVPIRGELEEGVERRLQAGEPMTLRVLHTPGHARGHLCFLDAERGSLVAGDLVSAVSTIVVDPPEGDMDDYLASLERVRGLPLTTLLPSHGPAMPEPARTVAELIEHRLWREERIVEAWRKGLRDAEAMLPAVYDDVPERTWPLAARQIEAHLERLRRAGRLPDAERRE